MNRLVPVVLIISLAAAAQAPQLLGYQGRLLTASGTPVTGLRDVRFTLFDAATGGTQVWTETQQLGLSDGYYATHLAASGADAGALVEAALASGTAWLEVAVKETSQSTFEVLTPRQRVGSVAYALWAKHLKGGTVDATSIAVNGTTVIDSSGRLTSSAGITAVTGAAPISVANGTTAPAVSLAAGTTSGDVLRWNGTAWASTALPVATTTTPGLVQGGTGLSLTSGVLSLPTCAAGQALVSTGSGWGCARVPSGATSLAQFSTYTVQQTGNPAPTVSCTAGDVATGCVSVLVPTGTPTCGTTITNGSCSAGCTGANFLTIVTCLRLQP